MLPVQRLAQDRHDGQGDDTTGQGSHQLGPGEHGGQHFQHGLGQNHGITDLFTQQGIGGDAAGNELFIAMALLPPGADIGTRLHYEMLCYTIIE